MNSLTAVPGTVDLARPLLERAAAADGSSPVSDQALLAVAQGQRELLLFREAASGEAAVAVGIVGEGEIDLAVDPAARGRGIGTAALTELLTRHSSTGNTAGQLLAWSHGDNPAADALLAAAAFVPVRSLFRMELDPSKLPPLGSDPLALPLPPGFALRTFNAAGVSGDAPADSLLWVRANAAAFATHPEQGRITLEDFELMRTEPWFAADDLLLLEAPGGQGLAGSTWVKTLAGSTETGPEVELYAIGVVPEHAGAGLGRVLLDATLARMAQHAPSRVTLYVDGENTRAVRMYEAAGFNIASRSRQWARNT